MSEVTRFELWIAISASLVVVSVLLPIVQLRYYRHTEWSPIVWIAATIVLFTGMIGFAYMGIPLGCARSLYTTGGSTSGRSY